MAMVRTNQMIRMQNFNLLSGHRNIGCQTVLGPLKLEILRILEDQAFPKSKSSILRQVA